MAILDPQGTRVPEMNLKVIDDGSFNDLTTEDLFSGKTVIVFGLPGAFTPTCSSNHVPRFDRLADTFKRHGVDDILCVSVNDAFVMRAWRKDQKVKNVKFVADGNGDFTGEIGLLVDKSNIGFGKRSWRYSMLVRDGVIEKTFIEPEKPGDPFEVSDADTMLQHIAPGAKPPHDVFMLIRHGCRHCDRAREALKKAEMDWEEIPATQVMLRAVSKTPTTPRVFIDGELIGGADELIEWLAAEN